MPEIVQGQIYFVLIFEYQVDQFINRILVEEDALGSAKSSNELFHALGDVGDKIYRKGDFAKSNASSLDVYLLQKVLI